MVKTTTRYKIFLVDDDDFVRKGLEINLRSFPEYDVYSFSSGEECIENLSIRPDIIFMDYHMGRDVMNGIEALREVKKIMPEVAIAILSAQDEITVAVEAMNNGAIDYLTKNEVIDTNVEKAVEHIVQKKELEDELRQKRIEIEEKNRKLEQAQQEILKVNQELKETNANLDSLVKKRTDALVRALNKVKESKEELENFVYRASHDLKGPTARLLGLVQVAKIDKAALEKMDLLNHLESVTQGMDKIVENFIYVYTIHQAQVNRESLLFGQILDEAISKAKSLPGAEGIEISSALEGNDTMISDPFLLKLIINNLVENAITFHKTPDSEDRFVRIQTSTDKKTFHLNVEDNGTGIAEEAKEKIFDMFFRGSTLSKGNGLGLYLVKKAIEKLDGEIRVDCERDSYTSFFVTLPRNIEKRQDG